MCGIETSGSNPSSPRVIFWAAFVVALVTGFVFVGVLYNDFTWWDDHMTIHHNPRLNPPSVEGVAHYWLRPHMSLYVPVTYTAWSAVAAVAYGHGSGYVGVQLSPVPFHAASLLVHATSATLVFLILVRLCGRVLPGVGGALLFAVHPVQVEPVAWASGLKDLLAGMFALLALLHYVRFRQHEDARQRKLSYGVATLAAALAMLAKPSAVVTPVLAGVIDWFFLRTTPRKTMVAITPWLVMSVVVAVVAKLVQPALAVERTPLWARLFIAGDALAFYLKHLVYPAPLAVDYARTPEFVMESGAIRYTWLLPAVVGAAVVLARKSHPWLVAAALVFLVSLSPVLGLVPFEFQTYSTVADHYLYLAMLGPALAVAFALSRMTPMAAAPVGLIPLILIALLTVRQVPRWHDDPTLWLHNASVNPRSWLAANNLGAYFTMVGDAERAYAACTRAVELNPDAISAHENLALYHFTRANYGQAADHLRRAIASAEKLAPAARPEMRSTYLNLARTLDLLGRPEEAASVRRTIVGW